MGLVQMGVVQLGVVQLGSVQVGVDQKNACKKNRLIADGGMGYTVYTVGKVQSNTVTKGYQM